LGYALRCLACAEKSGIRLYSISNEFEKNRDDYYALLEKYQRGSCLDLTEWINWFLQQITSAANTSMHRLNKIRLTTLFWDKNRDVSFNTRQTKLITRLLETDDFEQGISRGKYKSLAHTTDITAARDLKDLVDKHILLPVGEGRARKYNRSYIPTRKTGEDWTIGKNRPIENHIRDCVKYKPNAPYLFK